MATEFTTSISPDRKIMGCKHRGWKAAVISNGESWPLVMGSAVAASTDLYRLGLIPAYSFAAPTTTAAGTSTAGVYGIAFVYRSIKFTDGLTGDDIQSNASNIQDVTLTAADAVVATMVVSTDTKVSYIDIYAAQKISDAYGPFYRVVKNMTNTAATSTFNLTVTQGIIQGSGVTGGTANTTAEILETDNDFPYSQPIILEVGGRMVACGGITKTVTGAWTNANGTVTTTETIYNGIEFWWIRKDGDTTGGLDGRGTYLCRYATANTVTLVNADGTADTYDGTTGSGTTVIWTEPNRRYSKLLNPHAWPLDNTLNDYPSGILAAGKVPNTYRVLLFGVDWIVAEDYDRLPFESGLNYLSTEYGCSSPFSVVAAAGRLWWLDLGKKRRQILTSDGSTVIPISTQKIKTLLDRVTLDSDGDVWRVSFIHGAYYKDEEVIRWGLYLDDNTVPNFVLELDLVTGDVRGDPQFYPHRYLDYFTCGDIDGRNYIGQFGNGSLARLGMDNILERYYDWADASSTLRGSIDVAGNTTTTINDASATFTTTDNGLTGIQVLIWQENTDGTQSTLLANPTYYHCRISSNTATSLTIDYVEQMNVVGEVAGVGTALPAAPAAVGWKYAVGVIQGIIGPKWFTSRDDKTKGTFRELAVIHKGQALLAAENPVRAHSFENFDNQPKEAQYLEEAVDGQQVADTTKYAASFSRPASNPVAVMGFSLADNNVNRDTKTLDIESIILEWNEALPQDNLP